MPESKALFVRFEPVHAHYLARRNVDLLFRHPNPCGLLDIDERESRVFAMTSNGIHAMSDYLLVHGGFGGGWV
jgi:hypothetical protein